jgi:hypothetical protein
MDQSHQQVSEYSIRNSQPIAHTFFQQIVLPYFVNQPDLIRYEALCDATIRRSDIAFSYPR